MKKLFLLIALVSAVALISSCSGKSVSIDGDITDERDLLDDDPEYYFKVNGGLKVERENNIYVVELLIKNKQNIANKYKLVGIEDLCLLLNTPSDKNESSSTRKKKAGIEFDCTNTEVFKDIFEGVNSNQKLIFKYSPDNGFNHDLIKQMTEATVWIELIVKSKSGKALDTYGEDDEDDDF